MKVVVDTAPRRKDEIFSTEDWKRLEDLSEVLIMCETSPGVDLSSDVRKNVEILIGGNWRYGDTRDYPKLKAFMEVSGIHPRVEVFNYADAFARSIRVLSCAPAFGPQVAEMAVAMAINASREITIGDTAFKAGNEKYLLEGNEQTFSFFERTIGFIGYGSIARQIQNLLTPWKCNFIAYDPWLLDHFIESQGCCPYSLEKLMAESDVVFVLAIVSKVNKYMIDAKLFSHMKSGAVFALFSRAIVIDFEALCDALYAKKIRAVIDVFPNEPMPLEHRIRKAPNVVLSAHRAGSVKDDLKLIGKMVADDLEAISLGIPPRRMQNAEPELVQRL